MTARRRLNVRHNRPHPARLPADNGLLCVTPLFQAVRLSLTRYRLSGVPRHQIPENRLVAYHPRRLCGLSLLLFQRLAAAYFRAAGRSRGLVWRNAVRGLPADAHSRGVDVAAVAL